MIRKSGITRFVISGKLGCDKEEISAKIMKMLSSSKRVFLVQSEPVTQTCETTIVLCFKQLYKKILNGIKWNET